jgi:hypothetical protein
MEEENDVAAAAHVVLSLPDLNLLAPDEEKAEDTAPLAAIPTPSPEARVLLRRFASTMAARPAGIRRATWSPEALGLAGRIVEIRLNEAAPHFPPRPRKNQAGTESPASTGVKQGRRIEEIEGGG